MSSSARAVKLGQYLASTSGRSFDWAAANCCHFAAGWVALATGRHPMAGLEPTTTAAAALRLLRRLGGDMAAAWSRQLGRQPVPPSFAQVGDVVLLPMPAEACAEPCAGAAMGICMGATAVIITAEGHHAYLPMSHATAAWRIEGAAC